MRTRAVGLLTAAMVLGGLLASSASPAAAQLSATPFTAFATGDVIAVNALNLGTQQIAGVRAAASGANVNSSAGGLQSKTNEFGQNVGPARADKNAYGRGAAIEAGVLTNTPQPVNINQIVVSGLAEAFAPPPSPLVRAALDIAVNPTLFARTGAGEAQATYDPVYCPVGKPITYGRGFAENLELLGTATEADGSIDSPVLGTSTTAGTARATTASRTVSYVIANGDGTFGLVTETRQTLAPITLDILGGLGLPGLPVGGELLIEVLGEFGLRTVATGKPGGASVTHLGDPIIQISTVVAGVATGLLPGQGLTLSQIIGQGGLGLGGPLAGVTLTLGGRPRPIGGNFGTPPLTAADGTSASGAIDLLRVAVPLIADIGLFHMEGAVTVPAGGLKCQIPVSKTASVDPVTVGQDFNYVISIPTDAAMFERFFACDLVNISVVDTVTTESGSPRIQLISASNAGVISGNTVTWANIGNYQRGTAPKVLTINARIPTNSGAGVLRNTVNVSAALGNCQGSALDGSDIIQGNAQIPGIARLDGSAVTGAVTLVAPNVSRGNLAATGGNSWPLVAGGGFLLAALGLVRLRRQAEMVPATTTTTEA